MRILSRFNVSPDALERIIVKTMRWVKICGWDETAIDIESLAVSLAYILEKKADYLLPVMEAVEQFHEHFHRAGMDHEEAYQIGERTAKLWDIEWNGGNRNV
jgi:hypothetical protein